MHVYPAKNIQDATHSATDKTGLKQNEVANSRPVSANLSGVYQEVSPTTATYRQNLGTEFILGNLPPTTDHLDDAWVYKDRQGALAILLRQVREILFAEDHANPADKILEAYKYSLLIRKGDNVASKMSSTTLLEKVDEVLTTQKSSNTSRPESSNHRQDFSWKANTNLSTENLALFLEITEARLQEHEFTKKFFLQRTFLEWTQLLYFSLLPTTHDNKKQLRNKEKHKRLKRSLYDNEPETNERSGY
jgi:hypothetical protein